MHVVFKSPVMKYCLTKKLCSWAPSASPSWSENWPLKFFFSYCDYDCVRKQVMCKGKHIVTIIFQSKAKCRQLKRTSLWDPRYKKYVFNNTNDAPSKL